ncbi:MAG: chemotaxis protein CheD [Coriobacteriia bacterium]|nr:chemotaxis protein CheD [Coriobacteriia bacterium]
MAVSASSESVTIVDNIGGPWAAQDPNTILVLTGELAVAEHPKVMVTPALGSCVGVSLWDAFRRRGGLAHIMLPSPADSRVAGRIERFASVALPKLAEEVAEGSTSRRLVAKIAGGSTMFGLDSGLASIGERNTLEVKAQLALLRIPLVAEDTGGTHARSMELYLDTGLVVVRSYRYGIKEL